MLGVATVHRPRTKGRLPSLIRRNAANEDDDVGGTAWIKNAMGSEEDGDQGPEFGRDELNDMERLVSSLSTEADDERRRKRLAEVMEEGLAAEPDRFARLFGQALNGVGERAQAAAREAALERQRQDKAEEADAANEGSDDSDPAPRPKSPEELRLWALVDMMVQSKTRVKLHEGSLGSKGEFR